MSLVLALGANIGDPLTQLMEARNRLCQQFNLIAQSRIYTSRAQDYLDQPDFFNQVLEFELPLKSPQDILIFIQSIESELGRKRDIQRGPRSIDIDILFYDLVQIETDHLHIPHPRLWSRSFVVKPLTELPYFDILKHRFSFPELFDDDAFPLVE